jgi:hypothetical protein
MDRPPLDETQRRILEFICRWHPYETSQDQFEQRLVICGELRLALHEYDEACGGLDRLRLIVTDQPYSHDCDNITPTLAGRRAVSHPPLPGGLPWRILQVLADQIPAGEEGYLPGDLIAQAAGLQQDSAGLHAFQTACQALFNWGWISRQAEGDRLYARLRITSAGRQQLVPPSSGEASR